MKTRLIGIPIMLIAATVFGGEIKVRDSDPPILQFFAVTPTAPDPNHPEQPNFSLGSKPLLTIRSIRNLIVQADGKGVTIVLNETDSKKYAELTRNVQGGLLFFMLSEKPIVGGPHAISTPTENGIIEFSEARSSGDQAEYLRRRFGK